MNIHIVYIRTPTDHPIIQPLYATSSYNSIPPILRLSFKLPCASLTIQLHPPPLPLSSSQPPSVILMIQLRYPFYRSSSPLHHPPYNTIPSSTFPYCISPHHTCPPHTCPILTPSPPAIPLHPPSIHFYAPFPFPIPPHLSHLSLYLYPPPHSTYHPLRPTPTLIRTPLLPSPLILTHTPTTTTTTPHAHTSSLSPLLPVSSVSLPPHSLHTPSLLPPHSLHTPSNPTSLKSQSPKKRPAHRITPPA